jgi:hypothetical protein
MPGFAPQIMAFGPRFTPTALKDGGSPRSWDVRRSEARKRALWA